MLVSFQLDGVDHRHIFLVALDTLHERFAENEVIDVAVVDRVRGERTREPRLHDTWVKDATTVTETGPVKRGR